MLVIKLKKNKHLGTKQCLEDNNFVMEWVTTMKT
jgi:hypothetical protein